MQDNNVKDCQFKNKPLRIQLNMLKITFMGMHYIYKKGKLTND